MFSQENCSTDHNSEASSDPFTDDSFENPEYIPTGSSKDINDDSGQYHKISEN